MDKPYNEFPVYKKALGTAREINLLCKEIKDRDFCFLRDQLRRAVSSIVLNLAEGSGKWTKKDKVNFYRIARASAFECVGCLDLVMAYQLVKPWKLDDLKHEFIKIAGEIQALIFCVERRKEYIIPVPVPAPSSRPHTLRQSRDKPRSERFLLV